MGGSGSVSYSSAATPFGAMDDKQFQKVLANQERYYSQQKQLQNIKEKYTHSSNPYLNEAPSPTTFGATKNSNNSSLFGANNSFDSNNNSLFGSFGSFDNLIDKSKDLARFRLGLDQDQAKFSRGLREEESQSDFGRNFKLADQQIQGQFGLEDRRQNATTERLRNQLESQQLMQTRGFDQQNLFRAQSAALASRGLR